MAFSDVSSSERSIFLRTKACCERKLFRGSHGVCHPNKSTGAIVVVIVSDKFNKYSA